MCARTKSSAARVSQLADMQDKPTKENQFRSIDAIDVESHTCGNALKNLTLEMKFPASFAKVMPARQVGEGGHRLIDGADFAENESVGSRQGYRWSGGPWWPLG